MYARLVNTKITSEDFNSWKKYLSDNKGDDFFDVYLKGKYSEISDGKDEVYSVLLSLAMVHEDIDAMDFLFGRKYGYNILANCAWPNSGPIYIALNLKNLAKKPTSLQKLATFLEDQKPEKVDVLDFQIKEIIECISFSVDPEFDLENYVKPILTEDCYSQILGAIQ